MTYKTRGIILKKRDINEHDRYYDIFTADHGKIRCIARGIRKRESKLACSLQEFALLDFMIAKGKSLDYIAGVKIQKNYLQLKNHYRGMQMGYIPIEVVEKATQFKSRDTDTYKLLIDALEYVNSNIEKLEENTLRFAMRKWALRFLGQSGYEPRMDACEQCGKSTDLIFFNVVDSSVYCRNHPHKNSVQVNADALALMQGNKEIKKISSTTLRSFIHIVDTFLQARLEKGLHTVKVT